ncbi:MAG: ABC-2 family transporter protein [bacterium]|nr:ABC-2 family transporter protein [bacterium]
MRKYYSFFRLRLMTGLQYRSAALAGMVTQFFCGLMSLSVLHAFYRADPSAYPMTLEATASYIWLQQGLLAFFQAWLFDGEIFEVINSGNLAYELCRPIHVYDMWFARGLARRLSMAALRCTPILLAASFLPKGYGLSGPASASAFLLFLCSLALGLLVMVALNMLVYGTALFTLSADGLRVLFASVAEILAGQVIPLPFFPDRVRRILERNPFAAMGNVAFRIYSGDLAGREMRTAILLQLFWLAALTAAGRLLCALGEKKAVVQGG